ncbi:MAG: hypothetical protein ABSB22_24990 [Thermodesulfobacteriota bacterium]
MVKRKSGEMEIAEALAFFESVGKQAPADNQVITDELETLKRRLHEMLLNSVLQKSKRGKKD